MTNVFPNRRVAWVGLSVAAWFMGCSGNSNAANSAASGSAGDGSMTSNPFVGPNAGPTMSSGGVAGANSAGSSVAGNGGSKGAAGTGTGAGGARAGGSANGSSTGSAPTFTDVYAIIMQSCGGGNCHLNGAGAAGLSMASKMTAYTSLVGASSSKCAGQQRVVPGNPDTSVVVLALEHMRTSTCRPPSMPEGRPQLPQASIDTIRAWIMAGAMNN